MKIEQYGYQPSEQHDPNGTPARVTAVHRGYFEIVCDHGTGLASLKTGAYRREGQSLPTTGDFVWIDWQQNGESRILGTLPRKTFFSRLDPSSSGYGEQAVAANFDYVFLLQSMDRDLNPRRLERYLALAWQSGAMPVVVLTKADGVADPAAYLRAVQVSAIGVDVIAVSAKTGQSLHLLAPYLRPGKTIVFLGSSGVGKSTLVNALAGETVMETGGVREKDGRGRHTTSRRQLLLLQSGVMVIDTPGMRELGMWNANEGIEKSFADVEAYLGRCKFSDCRHQSEPGCAIKNALQVGELSYERWESYQKLHIEAQYAEDKVGYLRQKEQRFKQIAKLQKTMLAQDYRHAPCTESFICKVCGAPVSPQQMGGTHRNHCPHCLSSMHLDNRPGDRASLCKGVMDPVAVWARGDGEWAVIHRCRTCGTMHSNRIAADDNETLLLEIANKPLSTAPFPGLTEQDKYL